VAAQRAVPGADVQGPGAPYAVGLTAEDQERARRLLRDSLVISLHDHPVRFPARMEETPEYNRTGRQHAAYAGLAASGMTVVFDNMMDGTACVTGNAPWRWDDVITDLGMRQADLAHSRQSDRPVFVTHAGARAVWDTPRMKPDDVLVFSQPAAEIAYGTTVGLWVIGERVLTFRDLRSGAWKGKQDAGSYLWITAGVVGGFVAGFALASRHVLSVPDPVVWLVLGLIVAWAGAAAARVGRAHPGPAVHHQGPGRLAAAGRLDRAVPAGAPPSYLGLLITFCGLGLALGDLASVVMVVLPAIGIVRHIRVEEVALRAGLGDRYIEYSHGCARLIPGVW
jgi:protein-S-isoprenylcysteine O-methyltransferase Ste14